MNVSEESLVGVAIIVGVAVLFFSLIWPSLRRRWTVRRCKTAPEAVGVYTYEEFRRDLLDFNFPIEEILKRCAGKVPERPKPVVDITVTPIFDDTYTFGYLPEIVKVRAGAASNVVQVWSWCANKHPLNWGKD